MCVCVCSASFIAVELIDSYCVLISSKGVYFLKHGAYLDRDAIFLEVKYDDLYHCLVSRDHGKIYLQLTKKAEGSGSGVAIPGPSHQKPMVSVHRLLVPSEMMPRFSLKGSLFSLQVHVKSENLAIKISQEINYAKSLYFEQQLMLPVSENDESLLLEF